MSRRLFPPYLTLLLCLLFCLSFQICADGAFADDGPVSGLPGLAELESLVGTGPEVLAALAELDRDRSLLNREERNMGPRAFAGLTYGAYDEPESETSDDNISYQKLSGRAGISFPILGTWNRAKIERLQAQIQVLQDRQKADVLLSRNLTALRKAYAVLWVEQRRLRMLADFMDVEEEAGKILRERTDKGFLLEVDRLDFMAAFDLARQERAAAELRSARALKTINLATARAWRVDGELSPPFVPLGERRGRLDESLEARDLPELRGQEQLESYQERVLAETRDLDLEGNVDLGVTWGTDFPGSTGTGVYVALSLREPFGTLGAEDDMAREAAEAELRRVRQEGTLARLRARGELMDSLALYRYGLASLKTSQTQVKAACESIRENRLRHEKLPGDTYEKLLQSRNRYMKDALALFDAQALVLQTEMELIRFAYPRSGQAACVPRALPLPDGDVTARLLDPSWLENRSSAAEFSAPSRPDISPVREVRRTAYVWWADPFLDAGRRQTELDLLQEAGFGRMLLSFTAGEVRFTRSSAGRQVLMDLLEEARRRDLRVDLLLGDPGWILADQRQKLLVLIGHFSAFPFSGIHLDLEPDQLHASEGRRALLMEEMFRTVRAVRRRTALPLSLSIHPRYLEGDLGRRAGPVLESLGLEETAVMIYSTRTSSVAKRFRALLDAWPTLRLALAQSVEKALPRTQSFASFGQSAFEERMGKLSRRFSKNFFAGIFVQSWKDYREMKR